MFQNISEHIVQEEEREEFSEENNKQNKKELLKRIFSAQNIMLYLIAFMASGVSIMDGIAPFGMAIFGAVCSNGITAGIVFAMTLLGTLFGLGSKNFLMYLLTSLIFIVSMLIFKPKQESYEHENEKKKLGMYIFFSSLLVQASQIFMSEFLVYDLLFGIMQCIAVYIFYKIFSNSVGVIKNFGIKKAFSVEEAIGASLLVSIAISALGDLSIFNFSVRNILSILMVLALGWQNGILVGATSGVTIGVVLGIIGIGEPALVATYAFSGMIAGILNKFGKLRSNWRIHNRKYYSYICSKW